MTLVYTGFYNEAQKGPPLLTASCILDFRSLLLPGDDQTSVSYDNTARRHGVKKHRPGRMISHAAGNRCLWETPPQPRLTLKVRLGDRPGCIETPRNQPVQDVGQINRCVTY